MSDKARNGWCKRFADGFGYDISISPRVSKRARILCVKEMMSGRREYCVPTADKGGITAAAVPFGEGQPLFGFGLEGNMRLSDITEDDLTEELTELLLFGGLDYGGERGDLILVLGSRKAREYRVPEAARLYREGRAERLLLTGGKRQALYDMRPEYEVMLETAVELGVPRERILIEGRALNTAENMSFSREVIERELPLCRQIILVTTAYHMRRSLLLAEKHMAGYEFIPCPVQRGSTARDNWRLSEKGRRTARKECMKLAKYARNGWIDNSEL